jgi:hypothetical protein
LLDFLLFISDTYEESTLMQQTEVGFYLIQAETIPAGKPYHLKQRFESRTTCGALIKHLVQANERRIALLAARKQKLETRNQKIAKAVEETNRRKRIKLDQRKHRIFTTLSLAEKNRSSILDEQTRQCGSLVQRAKQIATLQHIKTQERNMKRRLALDEKLRQSEARRKVIIDTKVRAIEEYYRTRSPEQKKVQLLASKRVQRWFRRHVWKKYVTDFVKIGLSFDSCQQMPFPDVVSTIQKKSVVVATNKLLTTLFKASLCRIQYRNPARVMLSSYIIFPNAEEILEGSGPRELVRLVRLLFFL